MYAMFILELEILKIENPLFHYFCVALWFCLSFTIATGKLQEAVGMQKM